MSANSPPKLRTLVVEDDPADAMLVEDLLNRISLWSIEQTRAGDLTGALGKLEALAFDLALVDLNLPDASGLDTLVRLRTAAPHLPLIIISGMEDRKTSRQALRAGAQDYVIKDELNIDSLIKAIDQTLARAALELELRTSRKRTMEDALLRQNEAIRAEIGGELHDVLSQNLTAVTFLIKRIRRQLKPDALGNPALLDDLTGLVDQAILDVERLSHGLYPPDLERRGLNQALEELALYTTSLHELPCEYEGVEVDLKPETALQFYRIVQEAISNIVKHAEANLIRMRLVVTEATLQLEVRDNGRGFDVATVKRGLGSSTMQHRADAIGADLNVQSKRDEGTRVVCSRTR